MHLDLARVAGDVPDYGVAAEKRPKGLIDSLLVFAVCRFCSKIRVSVRPRRNPLYSQAGTVSCRICVLQILRSVELCANRGIPFHTFDVCTELLYRFVMLNAAAKSGIVSQISFQDVVSLQHTLELLHHVNFCLLQLPWRTRQGSIKGRQIHDRSSDQR